MEVPESYLDKEVRMDCAQICSYCIDQFGISHRVKGKYHFELSALQSGQYPGPLFYWVRITKYDAIAPLQKHVDKRKLMNENEFETFKIMKDGRSKIPQYAGYRFDYKEILDDSTSTSHSHEVFLRVDKKKTLPHYSIIEQMSCKIEKNNKITHSKHIYIFLK